MKYEINVNDTPDKKDFMVVVIIDDKSKTSSSFALGKNEKSNVALRLIKSAINKVKLLNQWKDTPKTKKKPSVKKPKKK